MLSNRIQLYDRILFASGKDVQPTTKPAGEGTGLGLSMTHDIIVKQHGGKIDVATEPGIFTEFIITLPRTIIPRKTAGGSN
jgi:signal transduction histidine kinase